MTNKPTIEQEVLDRIEKDAVAPKSRTRFVLKEWLLWCAVGLSVLIGGLTFATGLTVLELSDWKLLFGSGMLGGALIALPYFWLVLFALSIALAQYNIRHTERGYRFTVWMVAVWMLSGSLVSGSLLYFVGGGEIVDEILEERVGVYGDWLAPRHAVWENEERGLLSGRVSEIVEDEFLEVETLRGESWLIVIEDETEYRPRDARPFPGAVVRVVGEQVDDTQFEAQIISVKPEAFRFQDHGRFRPESE